MATVYAGKHFKKGNLGVQRFGWGSSSLIFLRRENTRRVAFGEKSLPLAIIICDVLSKIDPQRLMYLNVQGMALGGIALLE